MYERKLLRTTWNGYSSHYFTCTNGVKQGGVLSPILFTLYLDELLNRLRASGIGCYVGNAYVGAVSYADDITLMCPTRNGLQHMVNICSDFGKEYSIQFNASKSVCMCFSRSHKEFTMKMDGLRLTCENHVKHLGQMLTYDLNELIEIEHKRSDLIRRFQYAMANYHGISSDVRTRIFDSYCVHLYGASSWALDDANVAKYKTAWNICIRKIWQIDRRTHRHLLPAISQITPVAEAIGRRFIGLYSTMLSSDNETVSQLVKVTGACSTSISARNRLLIFGSSQADEQLTIPERTSNADVEATGKAIRELTLAHQGVCITESLTKDEMRDFIEFLCIN